MRLGFLVRRLIQGLIVLLGASVICFIVLRLVPGDPALLMLPENATPAQIEAARQAMGIDRPIWQQYLTFMRQMFTGDFGVSLRRGIPVVRLIGEHLPATAVLAFSATALAVTIAIPLGLLAGVRHNSLFDYVTSVVVLLGQSVPSFWFGMILILLLAVVLKILPTSGFGTWRHLVLPSLTLAAYQLALTARLMRSSTLDVLREDYVRTARAKGLSEAVVLFKHVFRNAVIPTITVIGLDVGQLLGGAIVTETLFSWPGLGFLTVQSVVFRDYPVVQGLVFLSAVVFVIINLAIDIVYALIDPRITVES